MPDDKIPGSDALPFILALTANAPQPAQPPQGFFKSLLTDFVGTMAESLKSGAFQRSVGAGLATRQRGSKASDAFAASLGAFPAEQQRVQEIDSRRRIQEMQAELKRQAGERDAERVLNEVKRIELANQKIATDTELKREQEQGRNLREELRITAAQGKQDKELAFKEGKAKADRELRRELTGLRIKSAQSLQASRLAEMRVREQMKGAKDGRVIAKQMATVNEYRQLERMYGDVVGSFEKAQDEVGAISSALGNIVLKSGGSQSPQFTKLSIDLARLKNVLLKIRSGSAVVDQEFQRIGNELPVLGGGENSRWFGDNADTFRIKLESGLADVQRNIELWSVEQRAQQTQAGGPPPKATEPRFRPE